LTSETDDEQPVVRDTLEEEAMQLLIRLCGLIAVLIMSLAAAHAQDVPNFLERYKLGVVHLTVSGIDPATKLQSEKKGTGFFITGDQRMLTVKHLFRTDRGEPLTDIKIAGRLGSHTASTFEIPATTLRTHSEFDVAMVRSDEPRLGHQVLPLCWNRPPQVGSAIIALGFPLGQDITQVDGKIGSLSPTFAEAWLTNTALNPGNSGGPVLSATGSVVGIVIGGFRENGTQNLNAILPIRVAQQFIENVTKIEQNCNVPDVRPLPVGATQQLPPPSASSEGGVTTLPAPPTEQIPVFCCLEGLVAELRATEVDDFLSVYVNDNVIIEDAAYGTVILWKQVQNYLKAGPNEIRVVLKNGQYGGCGVSIQARMNGANIANLSRSWKIPMEKASGGGICVDESINFVLNKKAP
jgi:S1-C subfamily serine protease